MYEDKNGRLIFHVRYGNCYEGSNPNTAHAEYFMLVDEEFRQAVKFLRDRMEGNITMYMNKQPCSMSTSHGRKTALEVNCTQELISFFNVYCSTGSIINCRSIYASCTKSTWTYHMKFLLHKTTGTRQHKCSTGPKNLGFLLVLKLLLCHKRVGRNLLN